MCSQHRARAKRSQHGSLEYDDLQKMASYDVTYETLFTCYLLTAMPRVVASHAAELPTFKINNSVFRLFTSLIHILPKHILRKMQD